MSDAQTAERAEKYAARAHAAELEVHDLRDKLRRMERDRNVLLAQVRDQQAMIDDLNESLHQARVEAS